MKKLFKNKRQHSGVFQKIKEKGLLKGAKPLTVGAMRKRADAKKAIEKAKIKTPTADAQLIQTPAAQSEIQSYLKARQVESTGDPLADAVLVRGEVQKEMNQQAAEIIDESPEILEPEEVENVEDLADELTDDFENIDDFEEADNFNDMDAFKLSPVTYAAIDSYVGEVLDEFESYEDEADNFILDIIEIGGKVANSPKVKGAAQRLGSKVFGGIKKRREKKKAAKNQNKQETQTPKERPLIDAAKEMLNKNKETAEIGSISWSKDGVKWGATNNKAIIVYVVLAVVAIVAVLYFTRKK